MSKNKNPTTTKPNYDYAMQKLYIEMFLSDAETFIRCQNIFDPLNFDQRLQTAAEFINRYVDEYKVMPEANIVNAATRSEFESVQIPRENYDWLMDEFENFSRHKGLERAIIASSDLLEVGDYGPVEKLIKDAIQISLNKDMGTDYFADPRSRLSLLKNSNGQISTGWPSVDKKLYGGFNRGELNIFCAASGGGKSLFLANMGVNWALAGLNVIYLTFELSEGLVAMRLDSMTTGIGTREIFRNLDDVELKVKTLQKRSGHLQVKYMPSGKNCNDIRAYLKEYQVKTGVKPDVLLIDYLDLMMPLSVKVSPSDLFVKDKYVSEEIRNLAMETQCITVTASQLNRSAVDEIEFDHSHISGGLSKIQTADNVIGIFTSRAMKERGRYQIQFMKTRSSSGLGQKVDLEFNLDTLRITDLGDEDDANSNTHTSSSTSPRPSSTSGTNQVMNSLKRTSVVSTSSNEPLDVANAPWAKPRAREGFDITRPQPAAAPKIRSMLNALNPEKD
jgi:KaiC/GvpD/RAD55 family RecA-like ATPase